MAVGVLSLMGSRVSASLKLFLLALSIVDDIGAILVIAVFYSEGISWSALGSAIGLLVTIVVLQRAQVRHTAVYVILGAGVWLAVFESGVHATIAGVALGLLTPATPFQPSGAVSDEARHVARSTSDDDRAGDGDAHHWLGLASLSREAVSPLDRFEHGLHPWTSYLIIPLFALANAGVDLGGGVIGDALTSRLTLGIVVGLVAGKVVGITAAAWAATRLGLAQLPHGTAWPQIVAVAAVAGIGFTVSLFIADLGFADPVLLDQAKVGVLTASLLAGVLGGVLLRTTGRETISP
jgi:NhaA family Na+:H+ antiporter